MQEINAADAVVTELVVPALGLVGADHFMHELLRLLGTGIRPDDAGAHAVAEQVLLVPAEQTQFQVGITHIGQVVVIRRRPFDVGRRDHDLLQAHGERVPLIGGRHPRQRVQRPGHATGQAAVGLAIRLTVTDPAETDAVGVVFVLAQESVVIPGKTEGVGLNQTTDKTRGKQYHQAWQKHEFSSAHKRQKGQPRQGRQLANISAGFGQHRQPQRDKVCKMAPGVTQAPRSPASTGAVSGRQPRHTWKASAACSTSMPRPSHTAATSWRCAQRMNGVGWAPYTMS